MPLFKRLLSSESLQCWCRKLDVTLVDIGASGDVHSRWKALDGHLRVIGVEPDKEAFQRLVDQALPGSRDVYLDTGLYDRATTLPVYLTQQQVCSSLYQPHIDRLKDFKDWKRFVVAREAKMQVERLDVALRKNSIADIDFVKVDTQGSELHILKGAGDYLTNGNIGIEVEVEFLPLYKGQPLFADVDSYLREQGYELFDLARHFWRRSRIAGEAGCYRGQLVFADALYFVTPDRFSSILAQYENGQEQTEKFIKAISVILIYGYYDYALALCEQATTVNAKVINVARQIIQSHLDKQFVLPEVRGKTRLAMMFEKISEWIWQSRVNYDDRKLGN